MTREEFIAKNFNPEEEDRDIILTNKKAFGDNLEHEYTFHCYDGIAYGVANGWHDPRKNHVIMSYPTIGSLYQYPAKLKAIREYCGIPESEPITYGDIAMKYGKIGKWFITAKQLNAVDDLATTSKMATWLGVTAEGNFHDLDNNTEISAKVALHDLVDGMTENDFHGLSDEQKFEFVKLLGSLL